MPNPPKKKPVVRTTCEPTDTKVPAWLKDGVRVPAWLEDGGRTLCARFSVIRDDVAPASGGGRIHVEDGAMKYEASTGSITTIVPKNQTDPIAAKPLAQQMGELATQLGYGVDREEDEGDEPESDVCGCDGGDPNCKVECPCGVCEQGGDKGECYCCETFKLQYAKWKAENAPLPKPTVCEWATTEGWGEVDSVTWQTCQDQAYDCECGLPGCSYEGVDEKWTARRKAWGCVSGCVGRRAIGCELCDGELSKRSKKTMADILNKLSQSPLLQMMKPITDAVDADPLMAEKLNSAIARSGYGRQRAISEKEIVWVNYAGTTSTGCTIFKAYQYRPETKANEVVTISATWKTGMRISPFIAYAVVNANIRRGYPLDKGLEGLEEYLTYEVVLKETVPVE